MALIICPQCGKSISDKAVKCPHCGMAIEKKTIPSKNDINIPKILLGIVVFLGGIMSIVPLFYDIYSSICRFLCDYDFDAFDFVTPPFFGTPSVESYLTIAVGLIGGLSCLGLCILGITKYNRGIRTTWLYWILSVVFSIVSAFGTFILYTLQ